MRLLLVPLVGLLVAADTAEQDLKKMQGTWTIVSFSKDGNRVPEAEIKDARVRSLLDGVAATERELLAVLERHGVRRIDPKGERFDHNFHQAVFEAERPDAPAGTVIEVLQPGYVLHDRLLRPAMVGVAKAAPKPAAGTDDAA